jgi:hypothetical protein
VFDSEWIDIAIGVVLVWFLLAVGVAIMNELINRLLSVRSKQLWHALAQMLDGAPATGLVATTVRLPGATLDTRPASPLAPPEASSVERLYATETVQALENHPETTTRTRINHIPTSVFSQAVMEMATVGPQAAASVGDFIEGLPNGRFKSQLLAIWHVAQGDVLAFKLGVEHWFDGQMARLSAIYRSQVRLVVTALGVLVALVAFAVGLRVDALRLASDLQRNENVRAAFAGAGNAVAGVSDADLAATGCPPPAGATTTTSAPDVRCVAEGLGRIKGIDVAFAPAESLHPGQSFGAGIVDRLSSLYDWRRVLGLVITMAAISFGAPFWWDVLRRLVGLRKPGGSTPDNG